jgi:hypothetical protein
MRRTFEAATGERLTWMSSPNVEASKAQKNTENAVEIVVPFWPPT